MLVFRSFSAYLLACCSFVQFKHHRPVPCEHNDLWPLLLAVCVGCVLTESVVQIRNILQFVGTKDIMDEIIIFVLVIGRLHSDDVDDSR